jgi:hypothetical protein
MNIKIEFPADRPDIAEAMGRALLAISHPLEVSGIKPEESAGEIEESEELQRIETAEHQKSLFGEGAPQATVGQLEPAAFLDEKGVVFNADFCGEAKEPFYASGVMKGQWKKKRGVDQKDYDAWYQSALPAANTAPPPPANGAPPPPPPPKNDTLSAGELIVFICENQAGGNLTQQDIDAAYEKVGVKDVKEIFDDEDLVLKLHATIKEYI